MANVIRFSDFLELPTFECRAIQVKVPGMKCWTVDIPMIQTPSANIVKFNESKGLKIRFNCKKIVDWTPEKHQQTPEHSQKTAFTVMLMWYRDDCIFSTIPLEIIHIIIKYAVNMDTMDLINCQFKKLFSSTDIDTSKKEFKAPFSKQYGKVCLSCKEGFGIQYFNTHKIMMRELPRSIFEGRAILSIKSIWTTSTAYGCSIEVKQIEVYPRAADEAFQFIPQHFDRFNFEA